MQAELAFPFDHLWLPLQPPAPPPPPPPPPPSISTAMTTPPSSGLTNEVAAAIALVDATNWTVYQGTTPPTEQTLEANSPMYLLVQKAYESKQNGGLVHALCVINILEFLLPTRGGVQSRVAEFGGFTAFDRQLAEYLRHSMTCFTKLNGGKIIGKGPKPPDLVRDICAGAPLPISPPQAISAHLGPPRPISTEVTHPPEAQRSIPPTSSPNLSVCILPHTLP